MKSIALIGECMIELNGEPFSSMQQTYGGDSLNTAVYLSRLAGNSCSVHFASAMGEDALSREMILRWQSEGVKTDTVLIDSEHQPGLYLIQLDASGERTFLYWRNNSAARYLLRHPKYDELEAALLDKDCLYLSGISLAILPDADREILVELLQQASSQGIKIVFDSNYRPALWQDEVSARNAYRQILAVTDLALVTNDDEQALWGDSSDQETLVRLAASGVKAAVLKRGSEACLWRDFANDKACDVTPNKVAKVVDTTSAGDSFNAGFLAGFLNDLPAEECALLGHQTASRVIQHKGAIIDKHLMADLTNLFARDLVESDLCPTRKNDS
ncbi:sugar kinase [Vibrio sp. SCSIO 43136]|uniref:sugar kinase n=1 Tax=Vibrio sp. SCSIO 43136 TaxID=2819101 RepID=UPI0020753AED|nr:sugar kinase [Vibrio sp. SCSIO 43136]USD67834.1 sugar kinase [Vibrio sp. SCSIO 43136]